MKNILFVYLILVIQMIGSLNASTEFYFIRHGESEVNRAGVRIGGESAWAELTDEGKDQARALGHYLKLIEFDAYYTSDVVRTQQTARYFFEAQGNIYQKIKRDHHLKEQSQGDWEGKLRASIYTPEIKSQIHWTFIPGDEIKGESQQQVAERMVKWIKEKIKEHSNQRILVFSHGLSIRYLVVDLFNLNREMARTIPIHNTSLTVIRYENGVFSCPILNDTSHLDAEYPSFHINEVIPNAKS